METEYSLDRDLMEAKALAEALDDYLDGDELYGSLNGMYATDPDAPTLTIGHLLLRLFRLQKLEAHMTPEQKAILTEVEMLHDDVRRRRTQRYTARLLEEVGARLRSLEAFTADCEDDTEACEENYRPEALRRTIIQTIVDGLQKYGLPDSDLAQALRRHDESLLRFTEPWHFLWDDILREVYPKDRYWWLYERPGVTETAER